MEIHIAENIKKYRTARGFTQSDLAALLSISTQAVNRWENGKAFPDISLLPLIAKHLDVSIDKLIGAEELLTENLKKELHERRGMTLDEKSEKLKNELRILEIYEELAQNEILYLCDYFQYIMRIKNEGIFVTSFFDCKVTEVRKMIRERLYGASMNERFQLLRAVAISEDEDKLELWANEYELPEYVHANFWAELLLERYSAENRADKYCAQNQKILYENIQNAVFCLLDGRSSDLQSCKTALVTLAMYSTRVEDIFICTKIITQVLFAEALLLDGQTEPALEMLSLATQHLKKLYEIPENRELCGSVSVLDKVRINLSADDKMIKCIFNIPRCEKKPLYDSIRGDKRFIEYSSALKLFFPKEKCRSWINEQGNDYFDMVWQSLLEKAQNEAAKLSDGGVVVMLTARGEVETLVFNTQADATNAEGAMRFLIEKKKDGDGIIERLLYMWHDGSLDFPSFDFRKALLDIDAVNCLTKMLLNGLNGYVVKTVKETMPPQK